MDKAKDLAASAVEDGAESVEPEVATDEDLAALGSDAVVNAQAEADPAEEATAESEPFIGLIVAEAADVKARMPGVVTDVLVRIGDKVEAGQPLAILDTSELELELAVAEARLESQRAALRFSKAELSQAARRYRRDRQVGGVIAGEALDAGRFGARKAAASRDQRRAELLQEVARVETLKMKIENATLKAPFAGKVGARYVDPAAIVKDDDPMVRVVPDDLRLRFAVGADDVGVIQPGHELDVTVEGVPETVLAIVAHISPELDAASNALVAEADLRPSPAVSGMLRAGQGAWVGRPKNDPNTEALLRMKGVDNDDTALSRSGTP